MEYASGGTLDNLIPIKDQSLLRNIALSISSALNYIHKQGIIHKDIKPGNLFLKNKDHQEVILGDFGISSLFDEEQMLHMTSQARSAIFAAPEQYQAIDDKVVIGPEIDFYALGIAMMYLWLGDNPFKGLSEPVMMRLKNDGKINYPEDMPKDILNLVKGLTVINRVNRWGFDEIDRWYNGEEVEIDHTVINIEYEPFYFDTGNNRVANSPEELAELLKLDPELGKKYLYRGKISEWLEKGKNGPLAQDINDITEKSWPQNQTAGLKSAYYKLKPSPYTAVDGVICDDDEKIAKAIYKNFEVYKQNLQKPDDELYIFYSSIQANDRIKAIKGFFKQYEPELALYNTIYFLNPEHPFHLELKKPDEKGNKIIECVSTEDIANTFSDDKANYRETWNYNLTEESYAALSNGRLFAWLNHRNDKIAADKVFEISDNQRPNWSQNIEIIYNLKPDLGLWMTRENEDRYIYTHKQVGNYLSMLINNAYQMGLENAVQVLKNDFENDDGELNCYFRARGWFDYIRYKQSCFDPDLHNNKIGDYNIIIACYKVAKAFLGNENPYIQIGNIGNTISSLEELSQQSNEIVVEALNNGILKEWLSIFFHEDPYLKEADVYERKLAEYADYIETLNPKDVNVIRFKDAKSKYFSLINKNKAIDKFYFISSIILPILMTVPALISIFILFSEGIPLMDNPLSGKFWEASAVYYAVLVLPIMIWMWMSEGDIGAGCGGGLIGGGILGIILYYVGFYAMKFLLPYVAIISMSVIILVLTYLLFKALRNPYTNKSIRQQIFQNSEEVSLFEPLEYAFNMNKRAFKSSKSPLIQNYGSERKQAQWRLWGHSFLGIAIFSVVLGSIILFHPAYAGSTLQSSIREFFSEKGEVGAISGTWDGTFEGRKASLQLTTNDNNDLNGSIKIYYKNPIQQTLQGAFNIDNRELKLADQKNIAFKGKYTATINEEWNKIEGQYILTKTGGKFPFSFQKVSE
jgi:hypothetical protein